MVLTTLLGFFRNEMNAQKFIFLHLLCASIVKKTFKSSLLPIVESTSFQPNMKFNRLKHS